MAEKTKKIISEKELNQQFNAAYKSEWTQSWKRPNVLICGYTGSGKSSLINTLIGEDVAEVKSGKPTTMGFDHYEKEYISIWDSRGMELGETEEKFVDTTRNFIEEHVNNMDVDNQIHLVWYAIPSNTKITDCDLRMIGEIFDRKNLIVVITKSDIGRSREKDALKGVLLENGIDEKNIIFTSDKEGGSIGCKELIERSWEMLPAAYRDAFAYAQNIDKERRKQIIIAKQGKAIGIIATATTAAAAAAVTPLPLSDAAIITPIQVSMIGSLAALYGLDQKQLKVAALPLLAKSAGMMTASSLTKLFPGIGSIISGAVAATLTGAIGSFVKRQFENVAIAKALEQPIPEPVFDIELFKKAFEEYKNTAK